jgi:5-methyltetrahydrofolate--homocysteine methyltransferase
VEWTKKTPEQPRFAAGSMGPMNRTLSISPDVNDPAFRGMTFDQAREAYEEQVRGLIDGGADLLLLETIFDTLNAKAGIVAIENVFEEKGIRLPVMISVTITDKSGRTLSGQTLDAFYVSIRHARPFSVGINCALGARDMRPYIAELARMADVLRQRVSERRPAQRLRQYDELPTRTSVLLRVRRQRLRQHLGGCCGRHPITSRVRKALGAAEPRTCRPRVLTRRLRPTSTPRQRTTRSSPASRRSPSGPTATSR